MTAFKPVQAQCKEEIEEYLKFVDSRSCDFPFATIYLWRTVYNIEYAVCEGNLVTHSRYNGEDSFSFPLGREDPEGTIRALLDHCEEKAIPFVMDCITKKEEQWLKERFPGQFSIEYNRDFADYIYETQALIDLKGKKYQSKRNFINRFKSNYDWSYEEVTGGNVGECLSFLSDWESKKQSGEDQELADDEYVSRHALVERDFLGLKAGLIRADGKVVAFALGERISKDTFCVHVEKARPDVAGAYAMINREFLAHEAAGIPYANREDDAGYLGLRKAKLSYHPAFLLEKGTAAYRPG